MQPDQLEAYLSLLGIKKATPSLELLNEILAKHIACLSFSALAAQLEQCHSLAPSDIYERLVEKQMGGYCYEQNSLLHDALVALGFDVQPVLARVVFTLDDPFADRALTHRCNVVGFDNTFWLADAGFSQMSPGRALPLDGTEFADMRVVELRPGDWHYQQKRSSGWKSLFRFDMRSVTPLEIEMGHFWSSVHPTATFVNNLVASRIYPDTTIFLHNLVLQEWFGGDRQETAIHDDKQLGRVLDEKFNIQLSESALTLLFNKAKARLPS